jgi:Family of unknown function (DUF6527)
MPTHVEGRRVENVEAIEKSGDYSVKYAGDGRVEAIWFAMPGFPSNRWNRINGPASAREPRWEITEDAEGKVTVSPSIRSQWTEGEEKRQCVFHCFLKGGVWELLDDCVGADL